MAFMQRIAGAAALGATTLIGCSLSVLLARAGYTVTFLQEGSDVVATGSGSINLAGLSFVSVRETAGLIDPRIGFVATGPAAEEQLNTYATITGSPSFGSGHGTNASSGSGDMVTVAASTKQLGVPKGYVSGTPLSDSSTYDNQSFASLGVTPGTYAWTWGSGPT